MDTEIRIVIDTFTLSKLSLRFTGKFVTQAITNAIYRKLINGILCPAPEFVRYKEIPHSSHLSEEVLAHRIGLIPLICDDTQIASFIKKRNVCGCVERCDKCLVRMKLDIKSDPVEVTEEMIMNNEHVFNIYSDDIQVLDNEHYNIRITPGIPLMAIRYGDTLSLEIDAVFNSAIEHAKWQCTVAVSMTPVSTVILDHSVLSGVEIPDIETLYDTFSKSCPRDILKIDHKTKKPIVDEHKKYDCTHCQRCEYVSREIGLVNPKTTKKFCKAIDTDAYRLTFESNGVMSTGKILQHALYYLEQDLRDLCDFFYTSIPQYNDDDDLKNDMEDIDYTSILSSC